MIDIDTLVESQGIFQTAFSAEYSFSWRLLSLREYQVFRGLRAAGVLSPLVLHMQVFERCYIGNIKFLDGASPAGMLISIGELIMWLSGDCDTETLKVDLEMARQYYPANSMTEYMKRVIFTAFPSYLPEHINKWTRPELIRKFTESESILAFRLPDFKELDLRKILSPEEQAAKANSHKSPINFKTENAQINKALGAWGAQEADQISRDINPKQAQQLDKLKRARDRQKQSRG